MRTNLRKRLLKEQTVCSYCGRWCLDDPTIDHIIPKPWGGPPSAIYNLTVSCGTCNQDKSKLERLAGRDCYRYEIINKKCLDGVDNLKFKYESLLKMFNEKEEDKYYRMALLLKKTLTIYMENHI